MINKAKTIPFNCSWYNFCLL